ncbi:hypothetical protein [Methylobacterium sp. AMS5]|uniref:hypothetical protein n=1 Tax=Methylobacterium sp. AMS5 TaxID=925818 RepID=UPI0011875271|nr:hypothetical protein [Methylobacterium sp. AMS5]
MAINAARSELQKISKIGVAASIGERAMNLAIAQQLGSDGKFKNPNFKLARQTVDGLIQYRGPLTLSGLGTFDAAADLHARMATAVQVDSTQQSLNFKIGFSVTALEIAGLKITRDGKPASGVLMGLTEAAINGILRPAQEMLNRLELRLPSTLSTKIDLKPGNNNGIRTTFEPSYIGLTFKISGLSHVIDNGRITAVLQESGAPNSPPAPASPAEFETLRSEFRDKLTSNGVLWMDQGEVSAYVDRDVIKAVTSRILSTGPICMSATAYDASFPFSEKVKLPASQTIDCTPTKDCTPKKECRQNIECAQREECRRCIKVFGDKHCINDPGCELRKVSRKGACEAQKEALRQKCEAVKSAEKLACEATKTGEKFACEGFKETYDAIRRTGGDYANVESKDLRLSGDAKICASDLSFSPADLRLSGKLQVLANARAVGHVKFTPLNVLGHISCFAPVSKALVASMAVPPQTIDFKTVAGIVNNSSRASLETKISNPIKIRFPVAALVAQLATDPQFTVTCPIPGTLARIRAFTPDSWWPKKARGDVDKSLPDLNLNFDIVKKPPTVNGLQLDGQLKSNITGIGLVLSISKRHYGPI